MWYIITFIGGGIAEAVAAYFVKKYKAKAQSVIDDVKKDI